MSGVTPEQEEAVRLAARILVGTALDLIERDSHQWSKRPCQTCTAISTIAGRDFGCLKRAKGII